MSTQSEHDRRAEIHNRVEAATVGPWHEPHDDSDLCVRIGEYGWITPAVPGPAYDVDTPQGQADAEFIAHSRTDVPWLLDLVEAKDAELEEDGWELAAAQMERDSANAERDAARKAAREWEKSATFLEAEHAKARDRANQLAYVINRAKQVEERPTDPGETHDETWMYRNEGFNEARRWFLMLLSDGDSSDDTHRALDGTPKEGA